MAKIIIFNEKRVNASLGQGRSLGLTSAQKDPLEMNFKNMVLLHQPVAEPEPVLPENLEEPTKVVSDKVVLPENSIPVMDVMNGITTDTQDSQTDQNEEVIAPFTADVPTIESVINPSLENNEVPTEANVIEKAAPQVVQVIEPSVENTVSDNLQYGSGVEIVPEEKETDFDKMHKELDELEKKRSEKMAAIDKEYQEAKEAIFEEYKKKIAEMMNEVANLKERAKEHLKNAQAAEQIATLAQQNSENIQTNAPSLELAKSA